MTSSTSSAAARMLDQVAARETNLLAGLAAKGIEPQGGPVPFAGPAYTLEISAAHAFGAARLDITGDQLAAIRAILAA